MGKKLLFFGLTLVLCLLVSGSSLGDGCLDETNPECYECKGYRFFPVSFCAPVTSDATVGRCYCHTVPLPGGGSSCQLHGDFCGIIIVVG